MGFEIRPFALLPTYEDFLRKELTAKDSILDAGLGSKYASGL